MLRVGACADELRLMGWVLVGLGLSLPVLGCCPCCGSAHRGGGGPRFALLALPRVARLAPPLTISCRCLEVELLCCGVRRGGGARPGAISGSGVSLSSVSRPLFGGLSVVRGGRTVVCRWGVVFSREVERGGEDVDREGEPVVAFSLLGAVCSVFVNVVRASRPPGADRILRVATAEGAY